MVKATLSGRTTMLSRKVARDAMVVGVGFMGRIMLGHGVFTELQDLTVVHCGVKGSSTLHVMDSDGTTYNLERVRLYSATVSQIKTMAA